MIVDWTVVGTWPAAQPFDLRRSLGSLRVGPYDPTCRLAGGFEKAFWSPGGPCTLRFTPERLEVTGPGTAWCVEHCGRSLCFQDGPVERPVHPVLRDCFQRLPGLRFVSVPWISDLAAGLVIQQRVTFEEAMRSYRQIIERYGDKSPCGNLRLPLSREQWLGLSCARLQSFNLDQKRAVTLLRVADLSRKIDRLYLGDYAAARDLLSKIPGIGPWTREGLLGSALGDPDAVQTGDVWLPHTVTFALTGDSWGSDERMVELLEPYAGYRLKVIRWLMASKS